MNELNNPMVWYPSSPKKAVRALTPWCFVFLSALVSAVRPGTIDLFGLGFSLLFLLIPLPLVAQRWFRMRDYRLGISPERLVLSERRMVLDIPNDEILRIEYRRSPVFPAINPAATGTEVSIIGRERTQGPVWLTLLGGDEKRFIAHLESLFGDRVVRLKGRA